MVITGSANRVLIIEMGSVLDGVVKSLVMREPELHVTTVACTDPALLVKEALNTQPNVIVVSEANDVVWTQISEILHRIPSEEPVRLIVIRLDENILDVYDKQSRRITRSEDLITFVNNHK